jgi:hypothetical protein
VLKVASAGSEGKCWLRIKGGFLNGLCAKSKEIAACMEKSKLLDKRSPFAALPNQLKFGKRM